MNKSYINYRPNITYNYYNIISYLLLILQFYIFMIITGYIFFYIFTLIMLFLLIITFNSNNNFLLNYNKVDYYNVFELIYNDVFFYDLNENDMFLLIYINNKYNYVDIYTFLKFFRKYDLDFMKKSIKKFRSNGIRIEHDLILLLNHEIDLKKANIIIY